MPNAGRPRSFDRTEALDQALFLFWQQGYEATTIPQLTEAMGGISAATLYATFGSKSALYRESVDRYLSTYGRVLSALFEPGLSPREALREALTRSADMQTAPDHPAGCLIALGASGWSDQSCELAVMLASERDTNRRAIAACLHRARDNGQIAASADIQALASLFDALLLGISVQARDGIAPSIIRSSIDAAMMCWDRMQ